MLLYSIVAGTGLGLMYVPAVVAVGYYFDKRRAFATGKPYKISDLGYNYRLATKMLYKCTVSKSFGRA
jgi:hypothetical protein